mmetsp:Transcript_104270/g.299856  ORF Transcript_104270/g.299856 Transcript_104270/m.299856 type:complete len:506 (-) Transcript_104270:218-1735(-)
MQTPEILLRAGDNGSLGVFTSQAIKAGDLVERCYCMPLKPSAIPGQLLPPLLYDRGLGGDEPLLLPFGWGMLFNSPVSGCEPNVAWDFEASKDTIGNDLLYINIRAKIDVRAGEELCIGRRSDGSGSCRNVLGLALQAAKKDARIPFPKLEDGDDLVGGILSSSKFDSTETRCSVLHGNGVFAKRPIKKGELVELAPNLVLSRWELGTSLVDYRFDLWAGCDGGPPTVRPSGVKVALGLGSIFNHNDTPNVGHRPAKTSGCPEAQQFMTCYHALRDIAEGEELCISYGQPWWESRKSNKTMTLLEWRLKHGETSKGWPFYDDPEFLQKCEGGLSPAMIWKLHHAFVMADEGDTSPLKAWMALCMKLEASFGLKGCINAPLRETGERATHYSAKEGQVEKLKWLVVHGADVNAQTAPAADISPAGDVSLSLCPAHVAAMAGQLGTLEVLHSSGADLNCKRPDGATPFDFAEDQDQTEAAAWLALRGGVSGIGKGAVEEPWSGPSGA